MPTFNLVLGQDVCAYGHAEVEAEDLDAAVQVAKDHLARADFVNPTREGFNIWDNVSDVEWDTAARCRIVSIENEATGEFREGIELDAPQPPKRTIWSLVTDTDTGTEVQLFTTEAARDERCKAIVADWWGEDNPHMPDDWREALAELSDNRLCDSWLVLNEHEVAL